MVQDIFSGKCHLMTIPNQSDSESDDDRLLKRQSLSLTVLFRTTFTRTITPDKLLILLGANHLLLLIDCFHQASLTVTCWLNTGPLAIRCTDSLLRPHQLITRITLESSDISQDGVPGHRYDAICGCTN